MLLEAEGSCQALPPQEEVHPPLPLDHALPPQEEEMSQEVHQVQQVQALLLQQKDQEEGLQDRAQVPLLIEEEMPGPQVQAGQSLLQEGQEDDLPQLHQVLLYAQEEVSPPQMQDGNTLLCEQKNQEEVLQEGAPVPLHSAWLLPQVPYVKALHQEQKD